MVVKSHHGSPKQSLQWPSGHEDLVLAAEIGEVRVYLHDPVRLHGDDGADVDPACSLGQEWLILEPCDDVVEGPGYVEQKRGGRQIPRVRRTRQKDVCAVEDAKGQFEEDEFVEENTTAHVGDGNCDHDDDATDHIALGPCRKSETI